MKTKIELPLETRKKLSVASMMLNQPVVIVQPPKAPAKPLKAKEETKEMAEMRRLRVEDITRKPPEVVITRTWIHTASHFDAQTAVPIKLPLWRRALNWFKSELE